MMRENLWCQHIKFGTNIQSIHVCDQITQITLFTPMSHDLIGGLCSKSVIVDLAIKWFMLSGGAVSFLIRKVSADQMNIISLASWHTQGSGPVSSEDDAAPVILWYVALLRVSVSPSELWHMTWGSNAINRLPTSTLASSSPTIAARLPARGCHLPARWRQWRGGDSQPYACNLAHISRSNLRPWSFQSGEPALEWRDLWACLVTKFWTSKTYCMAPSYCI